MEYVGFTQDVAKYVKEQVAPTAPSLEFSMIALAGGSLKRKVEVCASDLCQ